MQLSPLTAPALQPRVFHYSLDWRFLLPAADPARVYVLFEPDAEFGQTLVHAGIPLPNHLSVPEFTRGKVRQGQSLVIPFGLSARWVGASPEEQIEFYASARRWIASGGYLLVGFNHPWNRRARSGNLYYSSAPRRVEDQLKKAGYSSIKLFGAMHNLRIPEYIFDLEPRTIQFALQNRFRRKPAVLRVLRLLAATIGLSPLSDLLPCYFVAASA